MCACLPNFVCSRFNDTLTMGYICTHTVHQFKYSTHRNPLLSVYQHPSTERGSNCVEKVSCQFSVVSNHGGMQTALFDEWK